MSNKKREVLFERRMIQVDGEQVELRVELTFNHTNGQFTINAPIKTSAVSRDATVQAAVIQQIGTMTQSLMNDALALRNGWLQENPEETGPTLFDNEEEGEGGPDDEGQAEPVKLGMSAKGAKRKVDF